MNSLSDRDFRIVREFLFAQISQRREEHPRMGVASGSLLNLLRYHYPEIARKVRNRQNLVLLARKLGFPIHGYPGGMGLRGSGTWETVDLPVQPSSIGGVSEE